MVELTHKRGWDSKVFDTGKVEAGTEAPIFGTLLQNGLHDREPDGSFVECDTLFQPCTDGVSTNKAGRTRCGEVRISDTADESKQLAKVKSKELEGISLKLQGHRTYGPDLPTLREAVYSTYDGITVRQIPNYKGINIVLEIANPQTASNVYQFTVKEYGCTYTYEEIEGDIKCISSSGKSDIWIKALYARDANDDYGNVSLRLGGRTAEGYQIIEKVIDPVWLGNAVGTVETDPSVTIEDGVDGGLIYDANLLNIVPNDNRGANTAGKISGGVQNEVAKVDLSSYSGVTVTLAQWKPYIVTANATKVITVKKILRDWNEGNKVSAAADTGEVTYNSARHNEQLWTTPGGRSDGNDRSATIEWQDVLDSTGRMTITLSNSSVQSDIDTPAQNFGYHFDDTGSTTGFVQWDTSEGTNPIQFYMEYIEGGGGLPFFFDIGHY